MQRHECKKFEKTWDGEFSLSIVNNGSGWALAMDHGAADDAVYINCCPFCGVELALDGYEGKHVKGGLE